MIGNSAVVAATAAVLVGIGLGLFVRHRWRTRERRALVADLDDRLHEALSPEAGSHLETAPTIRRLAVVDADSDDETTPVYAPAVRIDLETTDAPGMKLVLEYVADVLGAIHPAFEERGERVHRYDVEFTFGPDGLLVEGECRRVSVSPALAAELLENDQYDAFDLRQDVKRADQEDGPTTLWADCRSISRRSGDRLSATGTRSE